MRKLFLLFATSMLIQSCYSFKEVANNSSQYEIGKYYRIKQDKKRTVVSIKSKTDSTLFVGTRKFEQQSLPIDSITKVEKRKFSILKTLLIPITYISLVGLAFAVLFTY
jgi:hypothetical protein